MPSRSARRRRPVDCSSPPESFLHPFAAVADLFDRLLYRSPRPPHLLPFIPDFIVLPACNSCPVLLSTARCLLLRSFHCTSPSMYPSQCTNWRSGSAVPALQRILSKIQ